MVPVIRDVDRKGIRELSQELGTVSAKARDGKLGMADLQGGCFTISSLGGIGGTGFTPIINAPELAMLGVVRSKIAPVLGRDGVRAATDAAAVAFLRSPGHRRCAGSPFRPAPMPPARRHPPARL